MLAVSTLLLCMSLGAAAILQICRTGTHRFRLYVARRHVIQDSSDIRDTAKTSGSFARMQIANSHQSSAHFVVICMLYGIYIYHQTPKDHRPTSNENKKMPPQADEHTVLLDSKLDIDDESEQQHSLQQPPPESGLNSWRIVILWTLAAALLAGMLAIWSQNGRSSSNGPDTTTSTMGMTRGTDTPTDRLFTNSKYQKVQGIGFQIYTGGAPAFLKNHSHGSSQQQQHLNPECIGRDSYGQVVGEEAPMLQCYIGLPDPMLDVRGRIEIMMDAVEKAYAVVSNDPNDNHETLKVFIAPEFFWRGITGAYSFSTDEIPDDPSVCGPICQILMGLENIVAQERFEDWIFLFGTIVASDTLPTDDPYDFLFYNFAPVYKGYNPEKMGFVGKRFLVPKRYVSSSDFLTPRRHLNESSFKQLMGQQEQPRAGDATVYNPHDFNQRRYDPTMWKKYKEELGALG